MKIGHIIQLDWYTKPESNDIFRTIFNSSNKRRQFGLLDKPGLPVEIPEISYKVLVSGKSGIGKTTLISILAGQNPPSVHHDTPGIQTTVIYWPAKLRPGQKTVLFRLEFWEAGELTLKKFDHIYPVCRESCDGILFLFSYTDKLSFEELDKKVSEQMTDGDNACLMVMGTKYAISGNSEISPLQTRSFENKFDLPVMKLKQIGDSLNSEWCDVALILNIICEQLWSI